MFLIKKFTKNVRITLLGGSHSDIPIDGISGYYPICESLKDAIEISEHGRYSIINISGELDRGMPNIKSEGVSPSE